MSDRKLTAEGHCRTILVHDLAKAGDAFQALGMLIVTMFPALFWTGILATGGSALGYRPSALVLSTVGSAIAAFLAAVWHALLRAAPA
jgi:hypothetical protein